MSDIAARYEALKRLLVSAGRSDTVDLTKVLHSVCEAVELSGCAVVADPYEQAPDAVAGEDWALESLSEYASVLWRQLVFDHHVESAFIQLAPEDGPRSLFAYPLREGTRVTGAILGLALGRRNLALEEEFLLALTTALQMARNPRAGSAASDTAAAVAAARETAILETAIAVNHEVNNPLTAVLGNAQLLLQHTAKLDAQTKKRLLDIEKGALRIKEVTQRLLKKGPHGTTEYPGGMRMLDLSDTSESDDNKDTK